MKLWPDPGNTLTVLAALRQPQHAVELLSKLREAVGDSIQAFELISDRCFEFVQRHIPGVRLPLDNAYPWFVLTDLTVPGDTGNVENELMSFVEDGLIADAVIAKSEAEAEGLWRLRHSISESQRAEGVSLKHDVSVPTSRVADFVAKGQVLVATMLPGARLVAFGHVGDGNLHFNVSQAPGDDGDDFRQRGLALTEAIYDLAIGMGGSFSAEHGIGVTKKDYLEQYRGGAEIELMRTLKAALDPKNTLNPGKVI